MPDQSKFNMRPIALDEVFYPFNGIVHRAVVNDDALDVRVCLKTDGLKTILNVIGVIEVGDNDRNFWQSRVDLGQPRIQDFDVALYRAHSKSSFSTTFSCLLMKYFGLSTSSPTFTPLASSVPKSAA